MSTPLVGLDGARLRAIAASDRPLTPQECAERARLAAALVEPGPPDQPSPPSAALYAAIHPPVSTAADTSTAGTGP